MEAEGIDELKFPPGSVPDNATNYKVNFIAKNAAEVVHNKKSANFRAWLHTALQPLVAYRIDTIAMNQYVKIPDEIKLNLEWVYGIRCHDTRRSLQYTIGRPQAESSSIRNPYEKSMSEYQEEIVYFVSNTVIMLNVHLNRQRFYTEHTQEIISMAVS